MANRFRVIVFLFLPFLSASSFASFPASGTGWVITNSGYSSSSFGDLSDAAASAIAQWNKTWGYTTGTCSPVVSSSDPLSAGCSICSHKGCNHGGIRFTAVTLSCPPNATLSGNQCTCDADFVEDNNACRGRDPCDGLTEFCQSARNKNYEWRLENVSKTPGVVCYKPYKVLLGVGPIDEFPGCNRGCSLTPNLGVTIFEDGTNTIRAGDGAASGDSCDFTINDAASPEPKPAEPPENHVCKTGEFSGYVNGVRVCIPAKSSSGVVEKAEKDNGDGTTTTADTTVKCENGVCTVIKETITREKETNNVVSETVTTTETSQDAFCYHNPTAGVCKADAERREEEGQGTFSGSCSSGFSCEGDAIQCAIAREQHTRFCQLDAPSAESALYESEKGKEGVNRGEDSSIDLGSAISTDNLIGGGTCLPDLSITVMGNVHVIPLAYLCPYLGMLGNLLVAVGLIMAVRIVGVH